MSPHWLALRLRPALPEAASAGATLTDPFTALAWRALQLTPWVAALDGALVLEISGSERLFGGRSALLQLLLSPPLAPLRCAQGPTALVALGRLWLAGSVAEEAGSQNASQSGPHRSTDQNASLATGWNGLDVSMPATTPSADALPLAALPAARPHLPTLERLGCRSWGQLRALPRAGLARRFGAGLLTALDQAYGLQSEVYPWLRLPEVFDAPLELAAQVESASAMLFGARRLLAQLLEWLRARQRGVLLLELRWELDARRSNALHLDAHHDASGYGRLQLRTAQATQDIRHLERLLAEQLARVVLPAPVLYLRLRTLATQPLSGESHSLLVDEVRSGDSLHHMLERVAARLGPAQVLCASIQDEHRPERMQHWQPWSAAATKVPLSPEPGALYPSWLLAAPQSLQVQHAQPQFHGPLALLAGPQRLEAGWLDGESPALRDYFVARSQRHGLLWIYCDRLGGKDGQGGAGGVGGTDGAQWYLHGVFA
jgi:protein ImuB